MRNIIRRNSAGRASSTYYLLQESSGNPSGSFRVSPFIRNKSILVTGQEQKSSSARDIPDT